MNHLSTSFVPSAPPVKARVLASSTRIPARPSHSNFRRTRRLAKVYLRTSQHPLDVALSRPAEIVGKAYQSPFAAVFTVGADVAEGFITALPHGHGIALVVHVFVDLLLAAPY